MYIRLTLGVYSCFTSIHLCKMKYAQIQYPSGVRLIKVYNIIIKYDPDTQYEGFCYKGLNCLKDMSTNIIYIEKGYLPDETFLDDYIKRYGKSKSR